MVQMKLGFADLWIFPQHCVTALRISGFFNIASNLDHVLFFIYRIKRAILIFSGIFVVLQHITSYMHIFEIFIINCVSINLLFNISSLCGIFSFYFIHVRLEIRTMPRKFHS